MMSDSETPTSETLNVRALGALHSESIAGPGEAADWLCDLLRSPFEINRSVREALALALERGRGGHRPDERNEYGHALPRLIFESGHWGKIANAVLTRREWFDAAERVHEIRAERGVGIGTAKIATCTELAISYDYLRDACRAHAKFVKEYNDPTSVTRIKADEIYEPQDVGSEDHRYFSRMIYIERMATDAIMGGSKKQDRGKRVG